MSLLARPISAPGDKPLTVLITGFGPFPGARFNPTGALVESLMRVRRPGLAGVRRIGHVFPTSYAAVEAELPVLIETHRPDVVLMFGLAARTNYFRIETLAQNIRSGLLADASGSTPAARRIVVGGAAFLKGRAPCGLLALAVRAKGLPVRLSRNAGRYLCNFAYWRALETATPQVVFVHVPKLPQKARPLRRDVNPAMTAPDLLAAAEAVLCALVTAVRQRRCEARRPRLAQSARYEC